MTIRTTNFTVVLSVLMLAACGKQEAATEPAPQAPFAVVIPPPVATAPAPVRIVIDPVSEIFLRPNWTGENADPSRMKPLGGGVKVVTLVQLPTEAACTVTDPAAVVEYLERLRKTAVANGLADIPYHFAIDRAGRAWQLRLTSYEGDICPNKNTSNVGILILGSPDQPMTQLQKEAAVKLVWVLWNRHKFPLANVVGRDDLGPGGSAGADVKKMILEIRRPR